MEREIKVVPEQNEQIVKLTKEPFLLTKTQNKTLSLDMAEGDQRIIPDAGFLLQSVVIEKPEDLIPDNIKKAQALAALTAHMRARFCLILIIRQVNRMYSAAKNILMRTDKSKLDHSHILNWKIRQVPQMFLTASNSLMQMDTNKQARLPIPF